MREGRNGGAEGTVGGHEAGHRSPQPLSFTADAQALGGRWKCIRKKTQRERLTSPRSCWVALWRGQNWHFGGAHCRSQRVYNLLPKKVNLRVDNLKTKKIVFVPGTEA